MEEVHEGDKVRTQHVIYLRKMDLPSLANIILEYTNELKDGFKNRDDYIKDMRIQNLHLKEQVEKIGEEK